MSFLKFFFGCFHYGVVEIPEKALISVKQCDLHMWHQGSHHYESPWVEAKGIIK